MNKRYLLEEQTGHPQDPGDVKWQEIDICYSAEGALMLAQSLSQQASYAETGLRIYDLEKEEVVWSNLSPELRRRTVESELNELKVEADEKEKKK